MLMSMRIPVMCKCKCMFVKVASADLYYKYISYQQEAKNTLETQGDMCARNGRFAILIGKELNR